MKTIVPSSNQVCDLCDMSFYGISMPRSLWQASIYIKLRPTQGPNESVVPDLELEKDVAEVTNQQAVATVELNCEAEIGKCRSSSQYYSYLL